VYKLLLCCRYLRTRFLAIVCIISVMLGVATLVVVNSVMSGFSTKLKDRLHGLLSDMVVETSNYNGFPFSDYEMMRRIKESPAGPHIQAMTPTVEVVAIMNFACTQEYDAGFFFAGDGQKVTRPVQLIGIDPKGRAAVGGWVEHLVDEKRKVNPSFDLTPEAMSRFEWRNPLPFRMAPLIPEGWPHGVPIPEDPPEMPRDPKAIIVGFAIACFKDKVEGKEPGKVDLVDRYVLRPGDTVEILTVGINKHEVVPAHSSFVVADYIKTEMAEYDSHYVYVPLDYLQEIRGTPGRSTSIQIKLKDYKDAKFVKDELRKIFPDHYTFGIMRWEDKQGALLAAIDVERGILNLLLFLIIGVAGFSILAIFSMIVVEKTRDIGILKSLGASNRGVMSIFLGYGLLLGLVGAGLGSILGLAITFKINEIEGWLSSVCGLALFPRDVYYFDKIPTNVQPLNVLILNAGAVGIAVFFSILPALRAAMLHPVKALRYE
jgi:lipoprotein-releasing system permease protein